MVPPTKGRDPGVCVLQVRPNRWLPHCPASGRGLSRLWIRNLRRPSWRRGCTWEVLIVSGQKRIEPSTVLLKGNKQATVSCRPLTYSLTYQTYPEKYVFFAALGEAVYCIELMNRKGNSGCYEKRALNRSVTMPHFQLVVTVFWWTVVLVNCGS